LTPNPAVQIGNVASSLAHLRSRLEQNDINGMNDALVNTQAALDELNAYPGGIEQLKLDINQLPSPLKEEVSAKLEAATLDHQINGELIRLAIQKNAALQAYVAQQSDSATYSNKGSIPGVGSGILSKKV
jgi:flagellar biosynthesis/type III secretory pathway chaperone